MIYQIYQPKEPTFRAPLTEEVSKEDYKEVYFAEAPDNNYLNYETIFELFNRPDRPADFEGHSLSVGDIVIINGKAKACDNFGWKDVVLK